MLFPYIYVSHDMEKMQGYIDYIFKEVWCQAPWGKYSLKLFEGHPELEEIIHGLDHQEPKGAKFFLDGIQEIFNIFRGLNTIDIARMKKWYFINNSIEDICNQEINHNPIRYAYLGRLFNGRYENLSASLKVFFMNLYSNDFLGLKVISDKIGDIASHNNDFMIRNDSGRCPFCGISEMMGNDHSKREAYDHYLPKAFYPFNSINFKNLVPACHKCNSYYKLSKDPAIIPKGHPGAGRRRKAFYPFSEKPYSIEIITHLHSVDVDGLEPEDIEIGFHSPEFSEEIETWKDVYGIEERYKAKFCNKSDGKYWLEQALYECVEFCRSPEEFLSYQARYTKRLPYADNNFLKKSFLEACERAGIFS